MGCRRKGLCRPHLAEDSVRRISVASVSGGAVCVSQEFDLDEVEIDFISFVPRGANRKKYFLVKEDRQLKEDILKSILETDEGEVSRIVKEARLEGEAAGVLEAAAKLLKAYRDELPEDALKILAKACGLPESEPAVEKNDPKNEGEGKEGPAESLSKEAIAKMDPATQAVVKQLLEENVVTKAEAREARQIAKELKDEKILKEYVEKAEDLPNLPIAALKFGAGNEGPGRGASQASSLRSTEFSRLQMLSWRRAPSSQRLARPDRRVQRRGANLRQSQGPCGQRWRSDLRGSCREGHGPGAGAVREGRAGAPGEGRQAEGGEINGHGNSWSACSFRGCRQSLCQAILRHEDLGQPEGQHLR